MKNKVSCPHCGVELTDSKHGVNGDRGIKVLIRTRDNEGIIWLSQRFGNLKIDSGEIEIKEGDIVEFFCPECERQISGSSKNIGMRKNGHNGHSSVASKILKKAFEAVPGRHIERAQHLAGIIHPGLKKLISREVDEDQEERVCEKCEAPMVQFVVTMSAEVCSRRGCDGVNIGGVGMAMNVNDIGTDTGPYCF